MPEQARAIFSFLLGICRKARLSSKACEELDTQADHRQLVPSSCCTYALHGCNRRSPVTTALLLTIKCSASPGKLQEKEELRTPVE